MDNPKLVEYYSSLLYERTKPGQPVSLSHDEAADLRRLLLYPSNIEKLSLVVGRRVGLEFTQGRAWTATIQSVDRYFIHTADNKNHSIPVSALIGFDLPDLK